MIAPQHTPDPRPSDAPDLLGDVVQSATRLLRSEMELARRDVARRMSNAWTGIVMLACAAIVLLTALDVLAAAAVTALTEAGVAPSLAALGVAVPCILCAVALFIIGKARLAPRALVPKNALASLRRDIDTIREKPHD